MTKRHHLAVAFLSCFCGSVEPGVYKCLIEGRAVYSQRPCAENAQEIDLKYHSPEFAETSSVDPVRAAEEVDQYIQKRKLRREIETLMGRKKTLARKRDTELAALKKKRALATNNLAGAVWEQSIVTEMASVSRTYNAEILMLEKNISHLRMSLEKLESND